MTDAEQDDEQSLDKDAQKQQTQNNNASSDNKEEDRLSQDSKTMNDQTNKKDDEVRREVKIHIVVNLYLYMVRSKCFWTHFK